MGMLHTKANYRMICPSPAFQVLVANVAQPPHHPAVMELFLYEPSEGHLAVLWLQPWMARDWSLAHAAPAGQGLGLAIKVCS